MTRVLSMALSTVKGKGYWKYHQSQHIAAIRVAAALVLRLGPRPVSSVCLYPVVYVCVCVCVYVVCFLYIYPYL